MEKTQHSLKSLITFLLCFSISHVFVFAQNVGQMAIDLNLPDQNNIQQHISFTGNNELVLLHFWTSWCPNSLEAIPSMKQMYAKYKQAHFKGNSKLAIYSISLDESQEEWKKAIKAQGLNWDKHFCAQQGFDSWAVKSYGVINTPTTFLIDPDGYVLMKNMTSSTLDRYLMDNKLPENIAKDYMVELGLFPTLLFHDFSHIEPLGELITEELSDGQKRVLVGLFHSEKEVIAIHKTVVAKGYVDAAIITRDIPASYTMHRATPAPTHIASPTPPTKSTTIQPARTVKPPEIETAWVDGKDKKAKDELTKTPNFGHTPATPMPPATIQPPTTPHKEYEVEEGTQNIGISGNTPAINPADNANSYYATPVGLGTSRPVEKQEVQSSINQTILAPPALITEEDILMAEEALAQMPPVNKESRKVYKKMEKLRKKAQKHQDRIAELNEEEAILLERYKFILRYSNKKAGGNSYPSSTDNHVWK